MWISANVVFDIQIFFLKEKLGKKFIKNYTFLLFCMGKIYNFCCFVLCSCKNIFDHGHHLASVFTLLDFYSKIQLFSPNKIICYFLVYLCVKIP